MAKIKSTLDLIMEKTSHMSLSDQEKAALKELELTRKGRGLATLFLNEDKDARFLAREIAQLPEQDRATAKEHCLKCFLERLSPFSGNERVLAGVETLAGQEERGRWETAIQEIAPPILQKQHASLERTEAAARESLASIGLNGPALKPALPGNRLWEEEKEALSGLFQEAVRKRLGRQGHK